MGGDSLEMCVGGSPVDSDSVCIEHGETACVTTVYSERVEEAPEPSPQELCLRLLAAQALRHVAADS